MNGMYVINPKNMILSRSTSNDQSLGLKRLTRYWVRISHNLPSKHHDASS